MHWTGYLMYGTILALLIPATFVSRTPLVLGVAWAVGEACWLLTGDKLPIWLYFGNDMISALLIWQWAAWREKLILAIYAPQWIAYLGSTNATALWWFLYWTTLAQFLIASSWIFRRRTQEEGRAYARSG